MSNFEVSYPQNIPLDAGQTVLRIVRAKSFVEEKALLAEAGWVVQGFAQRTLLGEGRPVVGSAPVAVNSEEEACAALACFDTPEAMGADKEAKAIPWALVFAAIKFLLEKFVK
jgi:hypothetical protein